MLKNLFFKLPLFHVGCFILLLAMLVGCEEKIETPPSDQAQKTTDSPAPEPIKFKKMGFDEIIGWRQDDLAGFAESFTYSCAYFNRKGQDALLTGRYLNLKAGVYLDICKAFSKIDKANEATLRTFIENAFTPYKIWSYKQELEHLYQARGLFTGYYESELLIDDKASPRYRFPILNVPDDLQRLDLGDFNANLNGQYITGRVEGKQFVPYYTREEIETRSQANQAHGQAQDQIQAQYWAKDALDLFILHIQGSGRGILPNGEMVRLNYAGNNGHRYSSIGSALIKRGELSKHQAGWRQIRDWLEQNTDKASALLHENPRYIFFKANQGGKGPFGSINQPLTPTRSLAVDPAFVPLGTPIWLDLNMRFKNNEHLRRLMVAQDTGNAIKGQVRGDFFWGHGKEAKENAGSMKAYGIYMILLPKEIQLDTKWLLYTKTTEYMR